MEASARHPQLFWVSLLALPLMVGLITFNLADQEVPADGLRYRQMTVSLAETGGFRAEYMQSVAPQPNEVENDHTHYFSPLWPAFQLPFYASMGPIGFEVAYLVACALALGAALLVSRDLFGDSVGLATVALLGIFLNKIAVQRSTEPLALALFIPMLWAILRSVRPGQQHWILLAGGLAGLAYLTRSSVGWLFLLGGAAGFAWRYAFHQRRALNRHYLAAIALFGFCYAAWAARNLLLFWDGTVAGLPHGLTSDAVFEWKFSRALAEPARLGYLIPAKIAFGALLLSPILALRWRAILWQLRNLKDETASGIFLTWSVPFVLGAVISAVFTISDVDPPSPLVSLDNLRYFIFAIPGLVWGPWFAPLPAPRGVAAGLAQAKRGPVGRAFQAPKMPPAPPL